jgi:hypothetical protein
MKFAILTMENVRTMVTVHDEALRDVKFKPAEDARIQVVQVTCFTSTRLLYEAVLVQACSTKQ